MQLQRSIRHLLASRRRTLRLFPAATLDAIEAAIRTGERHHDAELRVIVEHALPFAALLSKLTARRRALQLFGELGVWDTPRNTGVLIYLNLAEHSVEIVADRLTRERVPQALWDQACKTIAARAALGEPANGVLDALALLNRELSTRLPNQAPSTRQDELPDRPELL